MEFDVFFSISQTPVAGYLPDERTMFRNYFDQVRLADELGYGTAWIAESHYSSQAQKSHRQPVIPHWEGEVGLNTDICQLAAATFRQTRRIAVGSAVMNLVCNGGPLAAAERIAAFAALHGLDPDERRPLHVGFSAGRFDFINRVTGIDGRTEWEQAAWSQVKAKLLWEASEIFLRLLQGETLASDDVPEYSLTRADFPSDETWQRTRRLAGIDGDAIPLPRRWTFEATKIIPAQWRRELVQPIIGTHDPSLQTYVNRFAPVRVFNLSIVKPEVIEETHRRMQPAYHPTGGRWQRRDMPRTVFVFLNAEPSLSPARQRSAARAESNAALRAYWAALGGTLDPAKVANAADNALVGNPEDVAAQIAERFHPQDRLMLWFDFFNHNNARVKASMEAFKSEVVPRLGDAVVAD